MTRNSKERRSTPAATALGDGPYVLINPSATAVSYDLEGRSLGGGERVQVEEVDRVGRGYVRKAYLLCRDSSEKWIYWEKDGTVKERPLSPSSEEDGEPAASSEPDLTGETPGEPDQNSTDQVG